VLQGRSRGKNAYIQFFPFQQTIARVYFCLHKQISVGQGLTAMFFGKITVSVEDNIYIIFPR
jgi:hypothetical protein